jgi:hypothetical protein
MSPLTATRPWSNHQRIQLAHEVNTQVHVTHGNGYSNHAKTPVRTNSKLVLMYCSRRPWIDDRGFLKPPGFTATLKGRAGEDINHAEGNLTGVHSAEFQLNHTQAYRTFWRAKEAM